MTTFHNYIGGRWVDTAPGRRFENINPATGEALGLFPRSSTEDVRKAVDAAEQAFTEWRLMPAPKRGEILFQAGQLLVERKEEVARDMTREMGKVLKEARGDVQEAIDMAFFAAGEGRRLLGTTSPPELPNKFGMSVRMPIGVVGIITPWNFPMAIPSWKIFPALVAGNTIVFKPARYTPHSAYNFVKTLEDAGLPGGVLNLVFGYADEVGDPLVADPRVGLISFTGSTSVGTKLATECPKTQKRVSLEMGGKNAITVLDDADVDLAIDGILWSAFGTTGQRCTAGSRVIVHRAVVDELTEKLVARTNKLRLGNGLDETVDVGPVVNENQLDTVHRYTEIGLAEGATLLCGGERATDGDLAKGFFYRPTLFGNVKPTMRIAQEEIFGPSTAIIPVDSFEEAIQVNNGTLYGLSSSIYTRDVNRAFAAMRDLYTGIVYVNSGTIGAEIHYPFGGTKGTGNGHREAGQTLLDAFTEWKTIYVDFSGRLQKAQIDRG
ncbi:MAG: aldehyde dehydrogenase family protein [Candidatus Latescibacteria bacterium]|nr:aldehyde dehydrogenase family protein [Candidatus Latescibacterota bacterium]